MKVVADNKIPYLTAALEKLTDEIIVLPGDKITPNDLKDADALFVRTRTICNKNLLENSSVKFIATATIGYDHIDTNYCEEKGIFWTNAPGCNASSVAQYIHSSLLLLQKEKVVDLSKSCLGIIGVGNVGSKVYELVREMGMKVLLNDPIREEKGDNLPFTDLNTLAKECDILTLHTPLTKDGKYPTYHLVDTHFINKLEKKPILINTSRGEVTDTLSLLEGLEKGKIKEVILDVWENEPVINPTLLEQAFLATPHIAGYSADGKANATRMVLNSFCHFYGLKPAFDIHPPLPKEKTIYAVNEEEAILHIYNPSTESETLKQNPEKFEYFRSNYPLRREKEAYEIISKASV